MKRELHAGMTCVSFIGMAASGKSTVGRRLADTLTLAHVDTDHIIEATYGVCLQDVANALTKDEFLDMESGVISSLFMAQTVLSTGGSVVYRQEGMERLAQLGPIIHVHVSLPVILERIARKPDRGLAIAPGQTIEDLFAERMDLYREWADFTLEAEGLTPEECVDEVRRYLLELHASSRFGGQIQ